MIKTIGRKRTESIPYFIQLNSYTLHMILNVLSDAVAFSGI